MSPRKKRMKTLTISYPPHTHTLLWLQNQSDKHLSCPLVPLFLWSSHQGLNSPTFPSLEPVGVEMAKCPICSPSWSCYSQFLGPGHKSWFSSTRTYFQGQVSGDISGCHLWMGVMCTSDGWRPDKQLSLLCPLGNIYTAKSYILPICMVLKLIVFKNNSYKWS